jgi:broad specificity phosphatase PhoE
MPPLKMSANLSAVRRPTLRPTVYLLRHAHTDMNADGKQSSLERGWSGASLDDLGIKQAQQSGQQLMGKGIKNLVCSDLPRNLQTAQIVGQMIGADVQPTSMLRTWNTGDFTGGTRDETRPQLKQYFDNPSAQVPGGESYGSFYDRTRQAMAGIMQYAVEHPEENLGAMLHSNHLVALNGILTAGVDAPANPKLLDYSSDKQFKPGQISKLTLGDDNNWTANKIYEPAQS